MSINVSEHPKQTAIRWRRQIGELVAQGADPSTATLAAAILVAGNEIAKAVEGGLEAVAREIRGK